LIQTYINTTYNVCYEKMAGNQWKLKKNEKNTVKSHSETKR